MTDRTVVRVYGEAVRVIAKQPIVDGVVRSEVVVQGRDAADAAADRAVLGDVELIAGSTELRHVVIDVIQSHVHQR